jgi:aspartyl protease family protein
VNPQTPEDQNKGISTGMMVLAWLTFLILLGFYFNDVLEKQHNPNQRIQSNVGAEGVREVVLQRNRMGHYVTSGEINGQSVVFMLDTGATGIAIPTDVARRLKLQPGQKFNTQTANGIGVSYATRLDSVSVGEIEIRNIRAAISPGLAMDEILLGMSFLKHIEFSQRGNTLVLRQYPQQ